MTTCEDPPGVEIRPVAVGGSGLLGVFKPAVSIGVDADHIQVRIAAAGEDRARLHIPHT